MNILIGCTGFVGSNIYTEGRIDKAYHSTNIKEAFGQKPDLLIYAGVRAEKYLADKEPEKDLQSICQAEENIKQIAPRRLILISTVDVFQCPIGVDENTKVVCDDLHAYGRNRYLLECQIRERHPDALVVRLPGLFGKNIKKNFIYDYMNLIPFMLKDEKMKELAYIDNELPEWYELQDNGFYKCKELKRDEKEKLRGKFERIGFTALNFTDSRSIYQFYPLERLWEDLQTALEHDIRLLHLATEPVSVGELYYYLTGRKFQNELKTKPAVYDFRTIYDNLYGGNNGYVIDKKTVKEQIKLFIQNYKCI